jgi:hypothetical protein
VLPGCAALLLFFAPTTLAQVTGKVVGTVSDSETGQPLVGAQVVVEGTNLGNVTNEDGSYFVNNVPVGLERLTAQYLGYQTTSQEQRILAGQTMTVDFQLSNEVVQAEGIVAMIEREPLVVRDNTISKTRFTAEETRDLPVDDLESVIELGAGVYENVVGCGPAAGLIDGFLQGSCGFIVRGGRATESATFVDGVLITDLNSQTNTTSVSTFAVEETDVITGGFNAEWGHAQSGIINIVTREGGREYHGNVRFTTDELSDGIEQAYGYNNLQASLGGPIIPDKLTAYGSFEATGAEDFFPTAAGFNPATGNQQDNSGSTKELLSGNRGDRTLGQGKLTAFLPWDARATGTYLYSRDQFENHQPGEGLNQFLSRWATRDKTDDVILGYDQQIFQTGQRNLNLQVRGNYHLTRSFAGTPLTAAMAAVLEDHHGPGVCGSACSVDEDAFEEDFLNYRIGDVKFFFEDSSPSTVFNLPSTADRDPDPVFGQRGTYPTVPGFNAGFHHETERRYGLRVDLDSQVNRAHRAKAGIEWNWVNLSHSSGNFDSHIFAEVYDVDTVVAALYVQDRLDFGDLVIDLGLRWDHWDPNTLFPAVPSHVDCSISSLPTPLCRDAEVRQAPTQDVLAPRLGVAHPITDDTQVRLSYGKFYQLPELRHFFRSFLTDEAASPNPNTIYGNPNLDFIETTAFEAGITHQLGPNVVLDVVGYNRDRRGAIRLETFQARSIDPTLEERKIFVNGDNGNVKGFDLSLTKRYSNYWTMDLAWSLQWARGTTSSPLDWAFNFGAAPDLLEGEGSLLAPPTQLQPEDFDRLHNINAQFTLQLPDDFADGTAWGKVFENSGLWVTYNAQSGLPYTRISDPTSNRPLEDFNASRQPWFHSGDIRLTREFPVGAIDLLAFAYVRNFLDRENVLRVNESSGLPDRSGLEFTDSRNPSIPGEFLLPGVVSGFPFALDDVVEEWRDEFSRQDLDGDGSITLEESQETMFRAERSLSNSPFHYGEPRQVRLGIELRF